jgi:hypothetical protein
MACPFPLILSPARLSEDIEFGRAPVMRYVGSLAAALRLSASVRARVCAAGQRVTAFKSRMAERKERTATVPSLA